MKLKFFLPGFLVLANFLHAGWASERRRGQQTEIFESGAFSNSGEVPYKSDEENFTSDQENYTSEHEKARDVPTKVTLRGDLATPAPDSGIRLEFVPKQTYVQVRRYNTEAHLPKAAALAEASTPEEVINAPRLREVVSHTKTQEVYEEQGYEDAAYDHGGYLKEGHLNEKSKSGTKLKTTGASVEDVGKKNSDDSSSSLEKAATNPERAEITSFINNKTVNEGNATSNSSHQRPSKAKTKPTPKVRSSWSRQKVSTNEKNMKFSADRKRKVKKFIKAENATLSSNATQELIKATTYKPPKKAPFDVLTPPMLASASVFQRYGSDGYLFENPYEEEEEMENVEMSNPEHTNSDNFREFKDVPHKIEMPNHPEVPEYIPDRKEMDYVGIPEFPSEVEVDKAPKGILYREDLKGPRLFPSRDQQRERNFKKYKPGLVFDEPLKDFKGGSLKGFQYGSPYEPTSPSTAPFSSNYHRDRFPESRRNQQKSNYRNFPGSERNFPKRARNNFPYELVSRRPSKDLQPAFPYEIVRIEEPLLKEKRRPIENGRLRVVANNVERDGIRYEKINREKINRDKIRNDEKIEGSDFDNVFTGISPTDDIFKKVNKAIPKDLSIFGVPDESPWVPIIPGVNKDDDKEDGEVNGKGNFGNVILASGNDRRPNHQSKQQPLKNEENRKAQSHQIQQTYHENLNDNQQNVEKFPNFALYQFDYPSAEESAHRPTVQVFNSNEKHRETVQYELNGRHPYLPKDEIKNKEQGDNDTKTDSLKSSKDANITFIDPNPKTALAKMTSPSSDTKKTLETALHMPNEVKKTESKAIVVYPADFTSPAKFVENLTLAHFGRKITDNPRTILHPLRKKRESLTISSEGTTTVIPVDIQKYPFYGNTAGLEKYSVLRYVTNPSMVPIKVRGRMSFYESRQGDCEEPSLPKDIIPQRQEGEWAYDADASAKSPRLLGLGDKISCFKKKFFGADPLDNPFFKEETIGYPNVVQEGKNIDKNEEKFRRRRDIFKKNYVDAVASLRNLRSKMNPHRLQGNFPQKTDFKPSKFPFKMNSNRKYMEPIWRKPEVLDVKVNPMVYMVWPKTGRGEWMKIEDQNGKLQQQEGKLLPNSPWKERVPMRSMVEVKESAIPKAMEAAVS